MYEVASHAKLHIYNNHRPSWSLPLTNTTHSTYVFIDPNARYRTGPVLIPGRTTGKDVMNTRSAPDTNANTPVTLYGAVHGMQFILFKKEFTGDGTPRSTAFRTNGTGPCTPGMTTPKNPTAGRQPVSDQFHIQRASFVKKGMEGFGENGTAEVMHLGKPEAIVDNEEHERLFKTVQAAKEGEKKEEAGGAGAEDVVAIKVLDFGMAKKQVLFKGAKNPLTLAEKLKKAFGDGL